MQLTGPDSMCESANMPWKRYKMLKSKGEFDSSAWSYFSNSYH